MKLGAWYRRRAEVPLLALAVLVLGLEVTYFTVRKNDLETKFNDQVNSIIQVLSLGVVQHNRMLIETALEFVVSNMEQDQATLCHDSKPILSIPDTQPICGPRIANNVISKSLLGLPNYTLRIKNRSEFLSNEAFLIIGLSAVLLGLIFSLLAFIQARLKNELIAPLQGTIHSNLPLDIEELEQIRLERIEREELLKIRVIAETVRQVAHDIRSPLSALKLISPQLPVDFRGRDLLKAAIKRIEEIALDLLSKGKEPTGYEQIPINTLLTDLEEILTEKKSYWVGDVELNLNATTAKSKFVSADRQTLKRIFSNILQNSYEAKGKQQLQIGIDVTEQDNGMLQIRINDNGCGIKQEVLNTLGKQPISYGKIDGNGLGISHAKKRLRSWGGDLNLSSKIGQGTSANILLPMI